MNSLTIGYIWRVTKYCIVLYCIVRDERLYTAEKPEIEVD